jgi:hypothetical protein
MDDQVIELGTQLTQLAVRNTTAGVTSRIQASKAKRNNTETITELSEIIDELIEDKAEITRIARALAEKLVAQQISDEDIDYVTSNLVPKLEEFVEKADDGDEAADKIGEGLDVLKPLLSGETLTILQLLGFNFRQAIGEPLTQLVRDYILAAKPTPVTAESVHLRLQLELTAAQIALDPEAAERFATMFQQG